MIGSVAEYPFTGFDPVTLSVTGLPAGAVASFSVNPVTPGSGSVMTVDPGTAVDGDTDGADGSLDQPCEVMMRGHELIVVSMDMPWESDLLTNTKIDKPYTISSITLD